MLEQPNTAEMIVVGGGVMGCATAHQLAKDGQRVLVLGQFAIGNRRGRSHGASRLFRLAHTTTDYVERARAAHTLWHKLESETGEGLMQPVDALDFGSPGMLEGLRTTLHTTNIPFELLELGEIMHRRPHLYP